MYETYLQNEKELERLKARKERVNAGLCATCGRSENHNEVTEFGTFTHQWDDGIDAQVFNESSHRRLSLIKVLKSLEKELEGEMKEAKPYANSLDSYQRGINKGLQLSLDKIREFISKLEKEV